MKAALKTGNKRFAGYLENLSEDGVKWHQYAGDIENFSDDSIHMVSVADFDPGTFVELELFFPSGETVLLTCKVIWSNAAPPDGFLKRMGMKIIDPPVRYIDYVTTLR